MSPERARILIVDDEPANVRLLEGLLGRRGYTAVHATTDPREVASLCRELDPDLLLLDLHMPHLDGFAVLERLRAAHAPDSYFPILVLTADVSREARERALSLGATDFVTKPFDTAEVLLRVGNLLETRLLHKRLEDRVRERTAELERARIEILERLALAAEYRDDNTRRHTERVAEACTGIAAGLGLPATEVQLIRRAAPLHDVGKIGIPDRILLKPGRLTAEELEVMRTHTTIGGGILSGGSSATLRLAEEIALTHHERWDGAGYPEGLAGEQIPLSGRIVAVADVFDALTHDRPYKAAWPLAEALAEIRAQRGRQFDPRMVDAFLALHAADEAA